MRQLPLLAEVSVSIDGALAGCNDSRPLAAAASPVFPYELARTSPATIAVLPHGLAAGRPHPALWMESLMPAWIRPSLFLAFATLALAGCRSPYYADRGALTGGLAGAGVGALIGNAVGETAGGAAIGAGVGALTGGAIGGALDDIEARNRAEIAAQLGRQVAPGRATAGEVVAMTRAGVDSRLITNYVNNSGMAQPVNAQDVIYLTQQGVSPDVIQAMQTPRVAQAPPPVVMPPPGPVIIEEYHYGRPYCPPPHFHYYHHHHRHHRPHVGWGISFSG
jgi:hypothetical protein